MRPLIVINSLGSGGTERSTLEFVGWGVDRGWRPTVACLYRRADSLHDELDRKGVDIRFIDGRLPAKLRTLRRLVSRLQPDLVHTAIFESDVLGRLAALGGPPVMSSLVNVSYGSVRLQDPNIKRWKLDVVRRVDADRLTSDQQLGVCQPENEGTS